LTLIYYRLCCARCEANHVSFRSSLPTVGHRFPVPCRWGFYVCAVPWFLFPSFMLIGALLCAPCNPLCQSGFWRSSLLSPVCPFNRKRTALSFALRCLAEGLICFIFFDGAFSPSCFFCGLHCFRWPASAGLSLVLCVFHGLGALLLLLAHCVCPSGSGRLRLIFCGLPRGYSVLLRARPCLCPRTRSDVRSPAATGVCIRDGCRPWRACRC